MVHLESQTQVAVGSFEQLCISMDTYQQEIAGKSRIIISLLAIAGRYPLWLAAIKYH